jgi:hypothetical protein
MPNGSSKAEPESLTNPRALNMKQNYILKNRRI